jgi:hypothetical protein
MIRQLPAKRALVKRTNLSPVVVRVRQVWENPVHKRARKDPLPGIAPRPPRAIVPGHVVGSQPGSGSEAA